MSAPHAIVRILTTRPAFSDARSDLYALGAVGYYLLAGNHVFDGKTIVAICGQHVHETPAPLSARVAGVPADLEAVILSCLAKNPGDRPQSASELRSRLEACAVEPWPTARVNRWWEEHPTAVDPAVPISDSPEDSTFGAITPAPHAAAIAKKA